MEEDKQTLITQQYNNNNRKTKQQQQQCIALLVPVRHGQKSRRLYIAPSADHGSVRVVGASLDLPLRTDPKRWPKRKFSRSLESSEARLLHQRLSKIRLQNERLHMSIPELKVIELPNCPVKRRLSKPGRVVFIACTPEINCFQLPESEAD